jgi:excisionase family DNA binding protein
MDAIVTEGFITLKEFAEALKVSEERTQAWIRDGVLPAVRLGRLVFIPTDALRRMLERQEERHGT